MRSLLTAGCWWMAILVAMAQVPQMTVHADWMLERMSTGEQWSAQVPGEVHLDLMRHGVLPDPFFGTNVDRVQWVEAEDWRYYCTVDLPEHLWRSEVLELVFEGLDTYATVRWNGEVLGQADNMFRTWTWQIPRSTPRNGNRLEVHFRATVATTKGLAQGPIPPHDSDTSGVAPFVRKAAYQFGWDLAPRMVGAGIWAPVRLQARSERSLQARIHTVVEKDTVTIRIDPLVTWWPGASFRVRLNGKQLHEEPMNGPVDGSSGNLILVRHRIADHERWWPVGEGDRPLHTISVELVAPDGRVVDRQEQPAGFRQVELVQEADTIGRSFYFRVNGRAIYMKGANIVPPDLFPSRCTDQAWVALVAAAQRAHMNMLRVWGGGLYPPEAFFHACDTAGILVWQDLMFGYIPAPVPSLWTNIRHEVAEQGERIAKHPSLAIFCGNNELDVAWSNWGWQQRYGLHGTDSSRVADGYRTVFEELAPQLLRHTDVPYVHTSPLSNWGHPDGLRNGDLHYWGVWHADSAFTAYRSNVGRFNSEFGFQSYPDSAYLAKHLPPEELHWGSQALRQRQLSYRTDRPILDAIQREFGRTPTRLGEFIRLSQQAQARALREAIWWQRTSAPWSMGTLIWQLNDVWPGPSWSIMDHVGGEKEAFDEVRRGFADLVVREGEGAVRSLSVLNTGPDLEALLEWRTVEGSGRLGRVEVRCPSGSVCTWPLDGGLPSEELVVTLADRGGKVIWTDLFRAR